MSFGQYRTHICWSQGVKLLGCRICIFVHLIDDAKWFSKLTEFTLHQQYMVIFQLLMFSLTLCMVPLILAVLVGVQRCNTVVLICIFLVSKVGDAFLCFVCLLLATWIVYLASACSTLLSILLLMSFFIFLHRSY